MDDFSMEERLLREVMAEIYRDIAPERSAYGDLLIRKLASGLYQRGGRIMLGAPPPPKFVKVFCSVDPEDKIIWTCKNFHEVLGYPPRSALGRSIYKYLTAGSGEFRRDFGLPTLLKEGQLGPVPVSFLKNDGQILVGSTISQVLRDDVTGAFMRTFTRIQLFVPSLVMLSGLAHKLLLA